MPANECTDRQRERRDGCTASLQQRGRKHETRACPAPFSPKFAELRLLFSGKVLFKTKITLVWQRPPAAAYKAASLCSALDRHHTMEEYCLFLKHHAGRDAKYLSPRCLRGCETAAGTHRSSGTVQGHAHGRTSAATVQTRGTRSLQFGTARGVNISSSTRYPHQRLSREAKKPLNTTQRPRTFLSSPGSFLFRVTAAQLLSAVTTSLLNFATCHLNDV